jgi:hypothetical protein
LFHPDNIKNTSNENPKFTVSIERFFKKYGGYEGLAKALNTHLEVRYLPFSLNY